MSLLIIVVLVGGPLLLTVIAMGAHSRTRGRVDARHEWTWVRVVWGCALIGGVFAAWLITDSLGLGRGTMLIPAILGLFVVAGVGLGEIVVRPRRPVGPRSASLSPRRVADYLPRPLVLAVVGLSALHLATLGLTTATASADDMGRAGRQIAAQCGNFGSAAGPYPGSFYSVPLIALLLVIALVAAAAVITVVRRPRGFASDDVGDDVLRCRSVTRILAAAGSVVAASHVGIAFFAATALHRMDCQRAWMVPAAWVLMASAALALLMLGWCVGRLVVPGGVPATTRLEARR